MPSVDGNNYPGPWEIRIFYRCTSYLVNSPHQLRVSVDVDTDPGPGSPFSDYDLVSRSGLYYTAETFLDALVALMQPIYKTDSSLDYAELWKYASGSFNAAYQSAETIGLNGTSAAATVTAGQAMLTFRSQNGGSGRLNFMETVLPGGVTDGYPTASTPINNIFDFVTSNNSPVLARDGGYLFSPLNYLPGQNEAWMKNYYRP